MKGRGTDPEELRRRSGKRLKLAKQRLYCSACKCHGIGTKILSVLFVKVAKGNLLLRPLNFNMLRCATPRNSATCSPTSMFL